MPTNNIKCSTCGAVYGRGREKCPRCYGVVCAECLQPIYRWEDMHKNNRVTHGRCTDGPKDPEPLGPSLIAIRPAVQSPEIVAWAMLRSNSNEDL